MCGSVELLNTLLNKRHYNIKPNYLLRVWVEMAARLSREPWVLIGLIASSLAFVDIFVTLQRILSHSIF